MEKWSKNKIIEALKNLPQDKIINIYLLNKYSKQGLICHRTLIVNKFGTIKNACDKANINCGCLYGKEHMKHMANLNIKYKNKEQIIEILKEGYQKYGTLKLLSFTDLVLKINREEHCEIRNAIKKYIGTASQVKQICEKIGIKLKETEWSKEKILEALRNIYNESGGCLVKTDINNIFIKDNKICRAKTIKDKFGSIDKAAELAGIKFEQVIFKGRGTERINSIEKKLLDKMEEELKIPIIRQFQVKTEKTIRFLDGYIPQINLAIEIDEPMHQQNNVQDFLREQEIKNILNCDFERIKLY